MDIRKGEIVTTFTNHDQVYNPITPVIIGNYLGFVT
jgi:hypothetical protein